MSKFGVLSSGLRLLKGNLFGGGKASAKDLKKSLIVRQLVRNGTIEVGDSNTQESYVQVKFQGPRLPIKLVSNPDGSIGCNTPLNLATFKVFLNAQDREELAKNAKKEGSIKRKVDSISTGVVLLTGVEIIARFAIEAQDFFKSPKSWVRDYVKKSEYEKNMRMAVQKLVIEVGKISKKLEIPPEETPIEEIPKEGGGTHEVAEESRKKEDGGGKGKVAKSEKEDKGKVEENENEDGGESD